MKNKELFDKTIGILVNAYLSNTLEHFNCYACAVGNIVAGNCGYSLIHTKHRSETYYTGLGSLTFHPPLKYNKLLTHAVTSHDTELILTKEVDDQLKATGYSFKELIEIEESFEGVESTDELLNTLPKDEYMFNGLMAVCDTLMQIHEATTDEITEAKQLFVKA